MPVFKFRKRLTFRKKEIEPLRNSEEFIICCEEGQFKMTKQDFHTDFENIANSSSYQEDGVYNCKNFPDIAWKYKIAS